MKQSSAIAYARKRSRDTGETYALYCDRGGQWGARTLKSFARTVPGRLRLIVENGEARSPLTRGPTMDLSS